MVDHNQQSDLLAQYSNGLAAGLDPVPDEYLDSQLSRVTARLHKTLIAPSPSPAFVASLEQRLRTKATYIEEGATANSGATFLARPRNLVSTVTTRRTAPMARFAGVVVVAVTLVLGTLLYMRPTSISAREIVDRARGASSVPGTSVQSFALTATISTRPEPVSAPLSVTTRMHRWYKHPQNWRVEDVSGVENSTGDLTGKTYLQVSDGSIVWNYEPDRKVASVRRLETTEEGLGALAILPQVPHGPAGEVTGLSTWLSQAGNCYAPKLVGNDIVAGRAVHVVDIGASKCPSNSAPEINGSQTVWIDEETFFVLQAILYDASGKELSKLEVLDIEYNMPLDASLFTFTPPTGVAVVDHGNVPTEAEQEEKPTAVSVPTDPVQTLVQIRKSVDFPVFVPLHVPDGLRPDVPVLRREDGGPDIVQVDYRSASGNVELTVLNGPEGCCLDLDPRKAGTTMTLSGGGTVHLINVEPEYGGPILWWVQDGTYISVSAPRLSMEELVEIASSMSGSGGLR